MQGSPGDRGRVSRREGAGQPPEGSRIGAGLTWGRGMGCESRKGPGQPSGGSKMGARLTWGHGMGFERREGACQPPVGSRMGAGLTWDTEWVARGTRNPVSSPEARE